MSAAYSPDGTRIATASVDHTARVWDAATGRPIVVLNGHTAMLYFVAFSPDGTRIVTASKDRTARIWDVSNGKQIAVLNGHSDELPTAVFSPDGAHIAHRFVRPQPRAYGMRPPDGAMTVLSGHTDVLDSAAYSPDGTHIVTTSDDHTARIWDAATGQQIAVLNGHTDEVLYAAYSPDGSRIVTASKDCTARIWDAMTRTAARSAQLIQRADLRYFQPRWSPHRYRLVRSHRARLGLGSRPADRSAEWTYRLAAVRCLQSGRDKHRYILSR